MDPHLVEQYRWLIEEQDAFKGWTTLLYANRIKETIEKHKAQTLLDYGCGQGKQYDHELGWGVEVTLYDPAVLAFAGVPSGTFDGVICVDVLEHVPEDQVRDVIKDVYSHARRFAFFTVCPRPARKTLPDGRNCHLTIKPLIWWDALLEELCPEGVEYEVRQND